MKKRKRNIDSQSTIYRTREEKKERGKKEGISPEFLGKGREGDFPRKRK